MVTAAKKALLQRIGESVIGEGQQLAGPFGPRRITYADYTASGRALSFVEDYLREQVLPTYANTHTEASGTGLQTSRLREEARRLVRQGLAADDDVAVIFTGSGATAAIDKLIGILNLRIPADLDERWQLSRHIPADQRPAVFVGPFEHHSNELSWRETIADVVPIRADPDGHIDLAHLEAELVAHADRPLRIGSFSAASNVTGILSDTHAVTRLLHRHGALACWDFAAAAPYVDIAMNGRATPGGEPDPEAAKDAVFVSPHKFIGGPGTPGVLALRRDLARNRVPVVPGGGTVAFVTPTGHEYLRDVEHREEGGTPAIVESVRAGLVMQLKQAVGVDVIRERESALLRSAFERWCTNPAIEILGDTTTERLAIVSFVLRPSGRKALHHNFVVAALNDLFGIQARGGCSCAGPYGHRLLGIDAERSHAYQQAITSGCEGFKPGWVRVNLNYFIPEHVAEYVVEAVDLLARLGRRLLPQYRFDPATGLWRHRQAPGQPAVRLSDVGYDETGAMTYPPSPSARLDPAGADGAKALAGYLREARQLLTTLPEPLDDVAAPQTHPCLTQVPDDLRWFDLPPQCLEPATRTDPTRAGGGHD
jgi:selenocysteine lyase/cysteine desulfurase